MNINMYQVDAFTGKLFGGNPAAVCPLDSWFPENLMQNIAMENNLAETAFFVPENDHFAIRWFTPAVEINLCGHATLASGHVLFNHLNFAGDRIKFTSKSGDLIVSRNKDLLSLDFPADKPSSIDIPSGLIKALGLEPIQTLKSRDIMAVFGSEDDILAIKPDFELLRQVEAHAIIVTAPGKSCDFVSRFFAPRLGINEDPVTGSAHTALIPYWSERLGKKSMLAHQLSVRGGVLYCEHRSDRVLIGGRAVTYMSGQLAL
jgi:PhzF family phenazine biosynthesis protein